MRTFASLLLVAPRWLAVAAALLAALPGSAQGFAPIFTTPGGNAWWVEVYVEGAAPLLGVDARANEGDVWRPLTEQAWGAWASSFFVPEGAWVEFRARGEQGEIALSPAFRWPSGEPVDLGEVPAFEARFANVRGNSWWVEAEVEASGALLGVDARADAGPWQPLEPTGWGSWAASFFVPNGSLVDFAARGQEGARVQSGLFVWPAAEPVDPGPPGGGAPGFVARFAAPRGNAWWVEVEVEANAPLAGVEAVGDDGVWRSLAPTGWGSFAASYFVPDGSFVRFRARSEAGQVAQSGLYLWPDAILIGDDPPPPPSPPPSGGGDVTVSLDAGRGPNGAPSPMVVDRGLFSMNIADWKRSDYDPPHPAFLAYLQALEPGYLRWPAGERAEQYIWSRGGPGQTGLRVLTPDHVDAFLALCAAVGAEPLFGINLKTGTPEAAADLVRYLNLERGYGVAWFQLGNEPDFTGTPSPEVQVTRHNAWAAAMLAVDPNLLFVGPELLTGANVLGLHGSTDWMTPFLAGAFPIDGVSWHWYPLWSDQADARSSGYFSIDNLFLERAPDWNPAAISFAGQIMPALEAELAGFGVNAGIWITEYAIDSGSAAGAGLADRVAGALWAADSLGRYAAFGPTAVVRWIFSSVPEHAHALLDPNFQPRPQYYVYWLYARHWGNRVIAARSDDLEAVNAHAALRPDGALAVLLVNKSGAARQVALSLRDFSPRSAERYVLLGDGLFGVNVTLNGQALSPEAARDATLPAQPVPSTDLLTVPLAPYSVELRVLRE